MSLLATPAQIALPLLEALQAASKQGDTLALQNLLHELFDTYPATTNEHRKVTTTVRLEAFHLILQHEAAVEWLPVILEQGILDGVPLYDGEMYTFIHGIIPLPAKILDSFLHAVYKWVKAPLSLFFEGHAGNAFLGVNSPEIYEDAEKMEILLHHGATWSVNTWQYYFCYHRDCSAEELHHAWRLAQGEFSSEACYYALLFNQRIAFQELIKLGAQPNINTIPWSSLFSEWLKTKDDALLFTVLNLTPHFKILAQIYRESPTLTQWILAENMESKSPEAGKLTNESIGTNYLQQTKKAWINRGLASTYSWRHLLPTIPVDQILGDTLLHQPQTITFALWMMQLPNCWSGVPPLDVGGFIRQTLIPESYTYQTTHLVQQSHQAFYDGMPAQLISSFWRSVYQHFKQVGDKQCWDDFILICDWLKDEGFKSIPQRGGWTALWRGQEAWHEKQANNELNGKTQLKWKSLIDKMHYHGVDLIALTNTCQLFWEGKTMQHCVGSYDQQCVEDDIRIFSVLRQDLTVATLEIARKLSGKWIVQQLRGKRNAKIIDEQVIMASEHLAQCYTKVEQGVPIPEISEVQVIAQPEPSRHSHCPVPIQSMWRKLLTALSLRLIRRVA